MNTKSKNGTGLFIGRFQPFHDGHTKCIEKILEQHEHCIVGIRDTARSERNPFSVDERIAMIRARFPDVGIIVIPDEASELTVYIGRDVGYGLIQLDEETEKISGTDLRKKLSKNNARNLNL